MRKRKLALVMMRYYPSVTAFMICAKSTWHQMGIDDNIIVPLFGMSLFPTFFMMVLSYAYYYCWLYRTFTIYTFLSCNFFFFDTKVGIPFREQCYDWIHMIGILLFIYLAFRHKHYRRSFNNATK